MLPSSHPGFFFRSAMPEDIPALSEIWRVCFNDSPEYIRFFMDNRFVPSHTLVLLHQLIPIGALYLLPCRYIGPTECPAWYGYALGILPEFRGLGLSEEANSVVWNHVCKSGHAYLLSPANVRLKNYYLRSGFTVCSTRKTAVFTRKGNAIQPQPIDAGEYFLLREQNLVELHHVLWDEAAVAYAIREAEFCGGFAGKIGDIAFIGQKEGSKLLLKECTCPEHRLEELAAALLSHYGAEECLVSLPGGSEDEVAGMSMAGCIPPGCCLNLILD